MEHYSKGCTLQYFLFPTPGPPHLSALRTRSKHHRQTTKQRTYTRPAHSDPLQELEGGPPILRYRSWPSSDRRTVAKPGSRFDFDWQNRESPAVVLLGCDIWGLSRFFFVVSDPYHLEKKGRKRENWQNIYRGQEGWFLQQHQRDGRRMVVQWSTLTTLSTTHEDDTSEQRWRPRAAAAAADDSYHHQQQQQQQQEERVVVSSEVALPRFSISMLLLLL